MGGASPAIAWGGVLPWLLRTGLEFQGVAPTLERTLKGQVWEALRGRKGPGKMSPATVLSWGHLCPLGMFLHARFLPILGHKNGSLSVIDWFSGRVQYTVEAHNPERVTALAEYTTQICVLSAGESQSPNGGGEELQGVPGLPGNDLERPASLGRQYYVTPSKVVPSLTILGEQARRASWISRSASNLTEVASHQHQKPPLLTGCPQFGAGSPTALGGSRGQHDHEAAGGSASPGPVLSCLRLFHSPHKKAAFPLGCGCLPLWGKAASRGDLPSAKALLPPPKG